MKIIESNYLLIGKIFYAIFIRLSLLSRQQYINNMFREKLNLLINAYLVKDVLIK